MRRLFSEYFDPRIRRRRSDILGPKCPLCCHHPDLRLHERLRKAKVDPRKAGIDKRSSGVYGRLLPCVAYNHNRMVKDMHGMQQVCNY